MNFKGTLKALLLSILDAVRENYTYHSGALTYHFLLSIAPLTIVLVNILSLLPAFDLEKLELTIDKVFPQYTLKVIHEIIEIQRRIKETSLIAILLSYVFSVGFIKHMGRALSLVSGGELGEKREPFYWIFMPVFLLGVIVAIFLTFLLSIYVKFVIPKGLSIFVDVVYVIPATVILFLLYRSFLRVSFGNLALLTISFLISLLILLVQILFSWYIVNVFRGNLFYGSLSSIIVFLLWTNLIFLLLLLGARLIYRSKKT